MPERQRRIALNEARFREINEELRQSLEVLADAPETVSFVCECGHATCRQTVEVTAGDYEAVRADPRRFFVLPGHELLDTERVVEHGHGFLVVEKHGEAAPIVDSTDPRERSSRS